LAVGINPVSPASTRSIFRRSVVPIHDTSSIAGTVVFADPSGAPITVRETCRISLNRITITSSDPQITFPPGTTLTTPGNRSPRHYDGSAARCVKVTITAMSGTTWSQPAR